MAPAESANWTAWPLMMGPTGCSETSANYQHTLRYKPEERRSPLHRGESQKALYPAKCSYPQSSIQSTPFLPIYDPL
jgi:hypothetical protein